MNPTENTKTWSFGSSILSRLMRPSGAKSPRAEKKSAKREAKQKKQDQGGRAAAAARVDLPLPLFPANVTTQSVMQSLYTSPSRPR
jgi:hypothetical protein